jgi:hypothetical protein
MLRALRDEADRLLVQLRALDADSGECPLNPPERHVRSRSVGTRQPARTGDGQEVPAVPSFARVRALIRSSRIRD